MKRLFYYSLLLMLVVLVTVGCNKQNNSIENTISYKIEYETIGQLHNEGLDYILANFRKSKLQTTRGSELSTNELMSHYKQKIYLLTANFVNNHNAGSKVIDFTTSQLSYLLESKPMMSNSIYTRSENLNFTPTLLAYLDRLNEVVTDKDMNIESVLSRIEDIEIDAEKILTEDDAHIFFSAIYVAKNSLQYWHNNIEEWMDVLDCPQTRAGWFSWKSVGVMDVSGAVAGASACSVALFFGPVGWKAWAIGVAGGALGASAGSAAEQLLNYYL